MCGRPVTFVSNSSSRKYIELVFDSSIEGMVHRIDVSIELTECRRNSASKISVRFSRLWIVSMCEVRLGNLIMVMSDQQQVHLASSSVNCDLEWVLSRELEVSLLVLKGYSV